MTTPVKQYQNIAFKEILAYAQHNPNRHRILAPIEIQTSPLTEELSLNSFGLHGYVSTNMNPTGVLSVLSCIMDPSYYSLCQKGNRQQLIIDLATALQTEIDELKHTSISRKRKKIYDLIGIAFNGGALQDKDYLDLYQGLHYLRNIQFVLIKEAVQDKTENQEIQDHGFKGEIHFSSDPSTWKREVPVWVVDYKGHWVAVPVDVDADSIYDSLGDWLCSMEKNGWIVEWPEMEATKIELVHILSADADWKETDKKLTKEVLAGRLGKKQTLAGFQKWKHALLT